jgi:hypothetical protein
MRGPVEHTVRVASVLVKLMIQKVAQDKLRYRLLHVAARITRSARQTRVRIAEHWPWALQLVTAFTRLAALPRPAS